MPYQISIAKDGGKLFHTSPYSSWTVQALKILFSVMDAKFPEDEGYVLTVERFEHAGLSIDRKTFKAGSDTEDPKNVLKLFVQEKEFRSFQQKRTHRLPEELEGEIDELESYLYVTEVILYEQGFYILKRMDEDFISYLLPGIRDIDSDDLEELEYELYLSYLLRNPF